MKYFKLKHCDSNYFDFILSIRIFIEWYRRKIWDLQNIFRNYTQNKVAVKCLLLWNNYYPIRKLSGKCLSLESNQTKTKKWKLQTLFQSLFMRDNEKCDISHYPSTGLRCTHFSVLKVFELLITKDQKNIVYHH